MALTYHKNWTTANLGEPFYPGLSGPGYSRLSLCNPIILFLGLAPTYICAYSALIHDRPPDDFRDLRDDGVAEGSNLVHAGSKPIIHATYAGFGMPVLPSKITRASSSLWALVRPRRLKLSMAVWGLRGPRLVALGVGNNPNPISDVGGSEVTSSQATPPSIKPERGQVSENSANSPDNQICDVFHNDDAGSNFANEASIFGPQTAPFSFDAAKFTGFRNVLAGEPTADDINGNSICSEAIGGEFTDIGIAGNAGPVLGEDSATEGVDLAEGDGSHSGSLETETETADTWEKVEDIHFPTDHRRIVPPPVLRPLSIASAASSSVWGM
jgi:hypothetical protein